MSLQGFGDKRQFTLLFGVSASGKFAGRFQLIWNTLPKQGVMDSFKEDGAYPATEGGGGGLGLCRAAVPPHRVCRVTRVCHAMVRVGGGLALVSPVSPVPAVPP